MILCLGTTPTAQRTLIFDRVTIDAVNRALKVYDHASGKAVNVARVAYTLGEAVLATGFLGGDRGRFLRDELDRAGIAHDFVTVVPQTRLCTTVVDRSNGTATELVEESAAVAASDYQSLIAKFAVLVKTARMCVLSGSLPPAGPVDFYADCAQAALAAGCRVIIDARGEPLQRALPLPGLIVKLNREELAATVGRELSDDRSLRDAMGRVAPPGGATVVTLGSAGAVAFDGSCFWKVSSPQVKTLSAVGSGDSFAAGLAVGIIRGQSLAQACALGAACGAANAMTPLSGYVDAEEVRGLLQHVDVTEW